MIIDLRTAPPVGVAGGVLVVGSGAAGLALAAQLARAGREVVLLESGGDVGAATPNPDDLNEGDSAGLPYRLTEGRTRMLGGTTELWHGQCMRMHEIDLRPRPWIPRSGWPIPRAELERWYPAAEQWLGVTSLGYDETRWQEHPNLPPLAWDPEFLRHDFTEYTPQPMVGRVRRPELVADPRVQVVVNATVTRVLTDDRQVTAVEVAGPDGRRSQLPARQVVLAAGALENARILQLSDPDRVGLGDGRAHTGRYLQDHPIIRTAEVIPRDYRVLQDRYIVLHKGRRRLFPKIRLSPEAQEKYGLVDATAIFMHDHEDPALDAARRLVLAARSRKRPDHPVHDVVTALRAPKPVVRDTYRRYARGLASGAKPSHVWLQLWLEQAPEPDRRITLGSALDRFGLPKAEVHWSATDQELDTSRRLTRWIAADLARLKIAEVRELPAMHDDDVWRASVTDAFHPAGTTRMSAAPADGVVDRDLQVHGVAGLYAVGGSVFPTSGYANPTLTIVAMALRLADRLSRQPARTGASG